jgi:hypothetical protein
MPLPRDFGWACYYSYYLSSPKTSIGHAGRQVDIAKSVPSKLGRRYHCGGVIVTACGCVLIANFRFMSWLLSRTFDHCSVVAMLGPVPEVDAARALTKIVYA